MDALYTGRGPVCGITMRRGAGTMGFAIFAAADSAAIAVTAPAAPPLGAVPACGAAAACSVTAAGAAGASATGGAATTGALTAIFSSRAAGAAGCFTTTPAGGGATTTTGRAGATPTGALATTAPAGGRDAMAGVDGGRETMGGAERGCGTILRGSGLAGAASTGLAAIGAAAMGAVGLAGATSVGFAGTRAWRASSSSSFFLAWIAFSTSPGLEMCDRSILGATGSAPWRACAPPACDADFASRAKCARTFSASSSSSELLCVFPAGTPTSGRTSRIARDLTSSSFARSLIRTLLIRLFSMCAAKRSLVVHNYLMALAAFKTSVIEKVSPENAAQLTRRPLCPAALLQFRFRLAPLLLRLPHPPHFQPLQSPRQSFPPRLLP